MNDWKDKNGVWQPPDGIHLMRESENGEWHTYRNDQSKENELMIITSHTDCWCTNK